MFPLTKLGSSNRGEKPVPRIVLLWTDVVPGICWSHSSSLAECFDYYWYFLSFLMSVHLVLLHLSLLIIIGLEVPQDLIHSQPPFEVSSIHSADVVNYNYYYLIHGTLFMPCLLASYTPLDCIGCNSGILSGVIDLVLLLCWSVLSFSHSSACHI